MFSGAGMDFVSKIGVLLMPAENIHSNQVCKYGFGVLGRVQFSKGLDLDPGPVFQRVGSGSGSSFPKGWIWIRVQLSKGLDLDPSPVFQRVRSGSLILL